MSITVICGDPGAGKSALGVPLMQMHVRRADPRLLLSTYWIDVPGANGGRGVEVCTWPEMAKRTGAVCLVDETADLFNARDYAKGENKAQLGLFREHRKDGLTLYLITQGYDMLDTNIRQMTRFVWHVKRLFGPDILENETRLEQRIGVWSRAKRYLAKTFTKESEGHKKRVCLQTVYFRLDALYDRFDTLAKSQGLSGEKDGRGAGLAAGSALARERRAARAAAQRGDLPPWAYRVLGLSQPPPRLAAVRMPFTKEEYLAWSLAHDLGGHGRTFWRGPADVAGYDLLPEELQVHGPRAMPFSGDDLDL